jgi:hypothetical protein
MRAEHPDMEKFHQGRNARLGTGMMSAMVRALPQYKEKFMRVQFHLDFFGRVKREVDRSRILEDGVRELKN